MPAGVADAVHYFQALDDTVLASFPLDGELSMSKRGSSGEAVVEEIMRLYSQPGGDESAGEGHWLLDHMYWQVCVGSLVAINTLQLGLEMEIGAEQPQKDIFWFMEHFVTAAFCVEMIVKCYCLGAKFLADKWNYLDGVLCVMGVVDMWIIRLIFQHKIVDLQSLSILRILRLMRLVRVIKLMKQFRKVVLIINGVGDAIKTTCWVALLLLLAVYVCAIFCVDTIGRGQSVSSIYPGYDEDINSFDRFEIISEFNPCMAFGTLGRSMLTLFNMAIMAEWSEVVKPVFFKQPGMVVFFIVFGLFITCGVMNVIIGLIVDNVMTNAHAIAAIEEKNEDNEKMRLLHKIKTLFHEIDVDDDGIITSEELAVSAKSGSLRTLLYELGVKQITVSPDELMRLLDEDCSGEIDGDEFVMGLYRLLVGNDHERATSVVLLSLNQIKHSVREHINRQGRAIARIEEMVRALSGVEAQKTSRPPAEGAVSGAAAARFKRDTTGSMRLNLFKPDGRSLGLAVALTGSKEQSPGLHPSPAQGETSAAANAAKAVDCPILMASGSMPIFLGDEVRADAEGSSSSKGPRPGEAGSHSHQPLADLPHEPTPARVNEQPEPEEEGEATSGHAERGRRMPGCGPTIQNHELEYHLGRALASMRQLESSDAFYMDAANVRQMEELTRCLDAVRHEAEAAIKNQLRETLDGCLRVVRRAVESSRPEALGGSPDPEASSSSRHMEGPRCPSPAKAKPRKGSGSAESQHPSQGSQSPDRTHVQMVI